MDTHIKYLYSNLIFFLLYVSDIVMEDEDPLDEDTTIISSTTGQQETLNTFGRSLLQRLGIAHGQTGAETAGSQSSPNINVYVMEMHTDIISKCS